MGTVTNFPQMDTNSTPNLALIEALDSDLSDVLVVGYRQDGKLYVRSSRLSRAEALFLTEMLRKHITEI